MAGDFRKSNLRTIYICEIACFARFWQLYDNFSSGTIIFEYQYDNSLTLVWQPWLCLTKNVHEGLENLDSAEIYLVSGDYEYFHYLCDGFDDRGWGCGYRTLQTICSWVNINHSDKNVVPSINEIQETLVEIQDKPKSFYKSRQWIGSFEVCLVIDKYYDVPCKIIHVNKGDELQSVVDVLVNHFHQFGSPVMMGGDVDCSSKGIMGIQIANSDASLLVVDPHYVGKEQSKELLQRKGWVKWQPLRDFLNSSFYNLCLPQIKAKTKDH